MKINPKAAVQILTLEGFLRWAEGLPLQAKDFKKEETLNAHNGT